MSGRRGRRGKKGHGDGGHDGPDERWMASYMDMITVLMCMFLVLYAMSTIDSKKYEALKASLATGFGVTKTNTVDTAEGVIVPPDLVDKNEAGFVQAEPTNIEKANLEVGALKALESKIEKALEKEHQSKSVDFTIDERGLSVRLVGSSTYFDGNSAELRPGAKKIVDTIGRVLRPLKNQVSVEGNAADDGPATPYATVWELSSARATAVLRHLVESDGMKQDRVWAVAYGSTRPVASNQDATKIRYNRRVDIVVLSTASADVRALIPQVLKAEQNAAAAPSTG